MDDQTRLVTHFKHWTLVFKMGDQTASKDCVSINVAKKQG